MKLIVGLGNPGSEYAGTRHNAGVMALRRLAERHDLLDTRNKFHAQVADGQLAGERVALLWPTTYMNRSGLAVGEAAAFYKTAPGEVFVLVDDFALPLGMVRLRASGGDGGHNGLADVERALGTQDYPRLRIGVGAPRLDGRAISQTDHVLGRFTEGELAELSPALDRAAEAAECWLREGLEPAMNRFNVNPNEKPAAAATVAGGVSGLENEKPFGPGSAPSAGLRSHPTERRSCA